MMSHMQQDRSTVTPSGRSLFGSVSRRAIRYFVDPADGDGAAGRLPDDTAEFMPDVPGPPVATFVLPLTRSGGYEREAVDARLAELENELAIARGAAATPTGVEAEIQYLGEETAEILRVAHQRAEALVARATEEAAALRAGARADAEAVTRDAELRLRQLDIETDQIWAERTRLTDDTLRLADALRRIAESAVERFPAAPEDAGSAAGSQAPPGVEAAAGG
jgi:hypothetical protein